MKTVLITGHLGLTGRACVEHFRSKGWNIVGVDNNSRAHFFNTKPQESIDGVTSYFIDLREESWVEDVFKGDKFDAIIHCAAQPSHDYSTDHVMEDFDINARATLILLEATRKHCPDATFIFCSTDKVYGERMTVELREEETRFTPKVYVDAIGLTENLGLDFAGDRSLFGCSKAAADMYVQEYGTRFNMKTACFRLGCITGKNHQGAEQHGFLAYLAKCIKEGITYKIYGHKGKQVRDQIHANDLVAAFWAFIESPKVAVVYNMGGGPERSVSILEAAKLISEKTGKPFLHEFHEKRTGDRVWDIHDVGKFRREYPEWDYKYSLDDIINDLVS